MQTKTHPDQFAIGALRELRYTAEALALSSASGPRFTTFESGDRKACSIDLAETPSQKKEQRPVLAVVANAQATRPSVSAILGDRVLPCKHKHATNRPTNRPTNTNTSARWPPRFCMPMHVLLYYRFILLRFSIVFVTTAQFAINCDSHSKASSKCGVARLHIFACGELFK